jgi:hypothetical protein
VVAREEDEAGAQIARITELETEVARWHLAQPKWAAYFQRTSRQGRIEAVEHYDEHGGAHPDLLEESAYREATAETPGGVRVDLEIARRDAAAQRLASEIVGRVFFGAKCQERCEIERVSLTNLLSAAFTRGHENAMGAAGVELTGARLRIRELEAEVERLGGWLRKIDGGDNPCLDESKLRQ